MGLGWEGARVRRAGKGGGGARLANKNAHVAGVALREGANPAVAAKTTLSRACQKRKEVRIKGLINQVHSLWRQSRRAVS